MRHSRPGFTLIETIAAIVILVVAIPPMLWAIHEAQIQRANPVLASTARWLIIEKLEDVIGDRHGSVGYLALSGSGPTPVPGYPAFNRTVTVSAAHGAWDSSIPDWRVGPPFGYKTVTVAVDWTDAEGNAQTLSISTVLTDYPA